MNCFDKTQRLLKKSDYDCVFAQAKKMVTPEFVILHCANSLGKSRLGLALSKKMIPKAHDRNRLKRLLREAFRTTPLPAVDIIFLAKHGAAKVENRIVLARLSTTWKKLVTLYGA